MVSIADCFDFLLQYKTTCNKTITLELLLLLGRSKNAAIATRPSMRINSMILLFPSFHVCCLSPSHTKVYVLSSPFLDLLAEMGGHNCHVAC